jgi:protein-S-isoprenylcysteine O-methyltransferase Ste14
LTSSSTIIRALGLFIPVGVTVALWLWREPGVRERGAVYLATLWNMAALLGTHLVATRLGLWSFDADGGLFLGMPVDLYIGWALLWGAIPVLAFPSLSLPPLVALFLLVDLLLMPACAPVVRLGDGWLRGEAVALLTALLPAQLLGRWTRDDRHLGGRAALQAVLFPALTFGVLTAMVIEQTEGSWRPLFELGRWERALWIDLLAVPIIIGLGAVQEFARRGEGTPFPFDPPRRLVTSGLYAYLTNPMQVAASLLLVEWGILLQSLPVAAAGAMAAIYSAGIAWWDEREDMSRRFGEEWSIYRSHVRPWIPRWRPWISTSARLYVSEECGLCADVARWFAARSAIGLEIIAAENHPTRDLDRITYECDSEIASGVAAVARALDHINFCWATLGAMIRLPLLRHFLQLITDARGGRPIVVKRVELQERGSD